MTLEARAKLIAGEANGCCHRSDGWEEKIMAAVLKHLEDVYEEGWDAGVAASSED